MAVNLKTINLQKSDFTKEPLLSSRQQIVDGQDENQVNAIHKYINKNKLSGIDRERAPI